jgi:hypothetical protein
MYSDDGINWTKTADLGTHTWYTVCYGKDKYVALANNAYAISYDGIHWETKALIGGTSAFRSICYGNGQFVAVSGLASTTYVIAKSYDGINWTFDMNYNKHLWKNITYKNGVFIAVSSSGSIITFNEKNQNILEQINLENNVINIDNSIISQIGNGKNCQKSQDASFRKHHRSQ